MQRLNKILPINLKRDPTTKAHKHPSILKLEKSHWFVPFYFVHVEFRKDAMVISKLSGREFAIHDGTKVLGYAAYGKFYSFRRFYL